MDKPLVWMEDLGIGYCPILPPEGFYGQSYWDEYSRRAESKMGRDLTALRCSFVERWLGKEERLLDIGIGCGQFIQARGENTFGFDINPIAIVWLRGAKAFADPMKHFENMSFWDSLEHIPNASEIVSRCNNLIFVTIPIFKSRDHVLQSHHFKPGEHIWYFTREGLIRWFRGIGFKLEEANLREAQIGRWDVESFVFRRFLR